MRFGNVTKKPPSAPEATADNNNGRSRTPRTSNKPPLPEQARKTSSSSTTRAHKENDEPQQHHQHQSSSSSRPATSTTRRPSSPKQQSSEEEIAAQQERRQMAKLQREMQEQQQRDVARIEELQDLVAEWRKRRDAAQMVFMQDNSAVERLQKTLEQTNNRVAKKKQLLMQHSPEFAESTAIAEGGVGGTSSSAAGGSQQTSFIHHEPRRDAAVQCDAGLVAAVTFSSQLDAAQGDNARALQSLRRSVVDGAVQHNVQLAQQVAELVQRVRVMERELLQQVQRVREDAQTAPAQLAAAEQLVVSVIGGGHDVEDDENNNNVDRSATNASFLSTGSVASDLAAVHPEAVYRTVERARLALTQALVPLHH